MLKEIKSLFVLRQIFDYCKEKSKLLEMIIYNKECQERLGITIENYKNYNRLYKILDEKGKMIYLTIDRNDLIFKGEHLNGKKNGKGREFYNIESNDYILKFDGDYLNGKKNGKGKEYYSNGNLKFEGEYLNGERNGEGKEYDENGELLFKGEYFNDKKWNGKAISRNTDYEIRNGNGRIIYFLGDKEKFEGKYIDGEINGKGKIYFKTNLKFEGEFIAGKKHGKVYEYNDNGSLEFEGEYLKGEKNGKGKEYNNNGYLHILQYEGQYKNGEKNGRGKEYYKNGDLKFEGEFLNGLKWDGKIYNHKQEIINELKDGYSQKMKFENEITSFELEYASGKIKGKGKFYSDKDNLEFLNDFGDLDIEEYIAYEKKSSNFQLNKNYFLIFDGEFLNGKKHGKGKEFRGDKLLFEGEYLNGKKWNGKGFNDAGEKVFEIINGFGKGKEYRNNFDLVFEGEYYYGKRWNGKYKKYNKCEISYKIYEGEYINGYKGNGYILIHYSSMFNSHLIFQGCILDSKKYKGKEYDYNNNIIYEGKFYHGKKKKGKSYEKGKLIYDGEYLDNMRNGKGKEYCNNCLIYKGEYSHNKRNGKGKEYYLKKMLKFKGEFLGDMRHGKGKEYYKNGRIKFEGEYSSGKRVKGKEYYNNGNLMYEGEYHNNKKWNGKGYNPQNKIGIEIKDGSGKGKEYYDNGNLRHEIEYHKGKIIWKGKEYKYDGQIKLK